VPWWMSLLRRLVFGLWLWLWLLWLRQRQRLLSGRRKGMCVFCVHHNNDVMEVGGGRSCDRWHAYRYICRSMVGYVVTWTRRSVFDGVPVCSLGSVVERVSDSRGFLSNLVDVSHEAERTRWGGTGHLGRSCVISRRGVHGGNSSFRTPRPASIIPFHRKQ
jgi:hypothetical protein